MARPELHGRQYTIYSATKEDLIKWKQLCPPLTLNAWILTAIDRFVDEIESNPVLHPSPRQGGADINALRREIVALKEENQRLTARLSEFERRTPLTQPNPKLTEFLKKGEILKSAGSVDYWTIVDSISGKETYVDHVPTEEDIIAFKDILGYTKVKIREKDAANKMLVIRPSDQAGGIDINEIRLRHAKDISHTIEELENLGLIEFKSGGWKWIK
jgi:hypothetical protein